jgi:acyl transferase domain-containing protein/NAD(P)H-dependent flavin oxidoreductase YrpB (nitropropane dioxygenase family)/NADP-dependent 3-hydroxy acid dehydrogenase YdfG
MKRHMVRQPIFVDNNFECIVLAPCELGPPHIALGAVRAGGIGIIDLGFGRWDGNRALQVLTQVRWLCQRIRAGQRIGLRLAPSSLAFHRESLAALAAFPFVILFDRYPDQSAIDLARAYGPARILVEVRSLDEHLRLITENKIDGVVACGNEGGGAVGEDSSFILLQKLLRHPVPDLYVRGGIGVHSAAGCRAAGARGVILDDQLLLLREAQMPDSWKHQLENLTGTETVVLGTELGRPVRILDRPTMKGVARLRELSRNLSPKDPNSATIWMQAVEEHVGWNDPVEAAWPVGQAIGLAEIYRAKFGTVERALKSVIHESARSLDLANAHRPLSPGSPLAKAHGTGYPIVQGPMTRVSDQPEFARAVAESGGLPLIAVALLRGSQARPILTKTRELLGEKAWGVGLLGFAPEELRREQMEEVLRIQPRFALIAGGREDMARDLEKQGIPTYIHAPGASLVSRFLAHKIRRFVFEGRECGGHVGPLCSFPLWEIMIETLLQSPLLEQEHPVDVLFAGGIHDALSAAVVSAMVAPLAGRGVRCGVLMGTAYLFTEEAVRSGAILDRYQLEALSCTATVLLTTGVGHVVRVADTTFASQFEKRRRELVQSGVAPDEIRTKLEELMVGRLRLASKGMMRNESGTLVSAGDEEQARNGAYMLGQAATLRSSVCRIADLHRDVCEISSRILAAAGDRVAAQSSSSATSSGALSAALSTNQGMAIIGIATLVPGAKHPSQFWRNILDQVESLQEVPRQRWDIDLTFDSDKNACNKAYARWGGFFEDIPFDPIAHRIPPNVMRSISTTQLLALETTRWALADAGYSQRSFDRANTAVILGTVGGGSFLAEQLYARTMAPHMFERHNGPGAHSGPEWTGEMFAGVLANVVAGRVANHFDFGGPNYGVDAACASSLVALDLAVRELETGRSNMVITGGIDTTQTPFSYVAFSKTQALSPTGKVRVFDKSADGIVISEGVCIIVLKRLEDARRDGDRIYAVIRGTGSSSDGKGLGITVPKIEGQSRAIERALRNAGVTADSIGMYEAHGTGTPLGDKTELDTLATILQKEHAPAASCAVGSVKSLIGHTKTAAGIVGVVKAALALHHRVLPPHSGINEPLDLLDNPSSPIYSLRQPKPWLAIKEHPRRVGVSAFGFGGTNSHAVLEEACGAREGADGADTWPCELLLFGEQNAEQLLSRTGTVLRALQSGAKPRLSDLAYTLASQFKSAPMRLAIVARDLDELVKALTEADRIVGGEMVKVASPSGSLRIAFHQGADTSAAIAFLFPGQGSQYLNMSWEPALYLQDIREALQGADQDLYESYERNLSSYIFPPAAFNRETEDQQRQDLAHTHRAQPAIGTISIGLLDLLERIGVRPQMAGGHSYGELVALTAASVLSRRSLLRLSEVRGRLMFGCCRDGGMAAVIAPREQVADLIANIDGVVVANHNGPQQTIISGTSQGLTAAGEVLKLKGLKFVPLQVAGAFHSPLMKPSVGPWRSALEQAGLCPPAIPVYANLDGAPYVDGSHAIAGRLADQIVNPVEFFTQIKNMYAAGARTFVEVGPGTVLTNLVPSILAGLPVSSIALDSARGQLCGLLAGIAELAVRGSVAQPVRLFDGRNLKLLSLDRLSEETRPQEPSSTAWWINGTTARPILETPGNIAHAPKPQPSSVLKVPPLLAEHHNTTEKPPSEANPVNHAEEHFSSLLPRSGGNPDHPERRMEVEPAPPAAAVRGQHSDSVSVIHASYVAYQETMRRFLALEEQALAGFLALAGLEERPYTRPAVVAGISGLRNSADAWTQDASANSNRQEELPPQHSGPQAGASAAVGRRAASLLSASEKEIVPSGKANGSLNAVVSNGHSTQSTKALNQEEVEKVLLAVASERTGYPVEMLGLDLDIEAELGIDSLRRLEIVQAFLDRLSQKTSEEKGSLDELLRARTLRQVVTALDVKGQENVEHRVEATRPSIGNQPPGTSVLDHRTIVQSLLAAVSERTGYPIDMLGLDLDLEAELGIDSLRRMEIIEATLGRLSAEDERESVGNLNQLLQFKTLRQIAAALEQSNSTAHSAHRSQDVCTREDESGAEPAVCLRLAPTGVPRPLDGQSRLSHLSLAGKSVLLIEDSLGVAPFVKAALTKRGSEVVSITQNEAADRAHLSTLLQSPPENLCAIVHLAALSRASMPEDFDEWRRYTQVEAKSLFHILSLSAAHLGRSAQPRILAASMMDGSFGREKPLTGLPIAGASVGLLKSLAAEWPQAVVRAVDFDAKGPKIKMDPAQIAECITAELLTEGSAVEIGYPGGVRTEFVNLPAAYPQHAQNARREPAGNWVVLATGGARGITSEILRAVVKPGMTVVLVGRSEMPEAESDETLAIDNEEALRRHFVEKASRSGRSASPAEIDAIIQRVLQNRERTRVMKNLQSAHVNVVYRPCDVTDAEAFPKIIHEIYSTYGRIDAVLHGAGIVEDKLLAGKDWQSFDRVFDTKVDSTYLLFRSLKLSHLKLCVLFGSISGRFGNIGQTDYAAANEVLNRMAWWLSRRSSNTRVICINWGPWKSSGMATDRVRKLLAQRGILPIDAREGIKFFVDELRFGGNEQVEIVAQAASPEKRDAFHGATQDSSHLNPLSQALERPPCAVN